MPKFTLKGVNGQLYIYDDKIVIERKGFDAFVFQGIKGSKTIPLSSIYSVQFKKGGLMFNGYIQFGLGGSIESSKGIYEAIRDENTIMFKTSQNKQAEEIKDFIETYILERQSKDYTIPQTSVAEEILKFKSLLDSGVISEREFEKKKKELLN
jgi:hypothetical protein